MSLLRSFVLIVALGSSAVLPFTLLYNAPVLAAQLLANGGFEQDNLGPWKVYGDTVVLSRTPSQKRTGNYSAALTSNSASDKWIYQTVAVAGGSDYSLSGYILKNDPQVASVSFRIAWYASVDGTGPELYGSSASEILFTDSPEFRLLSIAATAPAGARSARVMGILHPLSTAAGTAYFDDLSLDGDAPAPTASPRPTATASPAATATASPSATATASPSATASPAPSATPSPSATATPSPLPGVTWTPSPTVTSTPGGTPSPTPTGEPVPTATYLPGSGPSPTPTPESGIPEPVGDARLVLSEVMVDPTGSPEASGEWVELYNAGTQTVDIGGWTLADNSVAVTLPPSTVGPGSYAVITGDSRRFVGLLAGDASVVQIPAGRVGNGLSNEADMVVLKDPSGQIRDSVNWGPPQATWPNYHAALWEPGLRPPPSGQSLARVRGRDASVSSAAWTMSLVPSPGRSTPSFDPTPTASATAAAPRARPPTATRTQTPAPNPIRTPSVVATPVPTPGRQPTVGAAPPSASPVPAPAPPGIATSVGSPPTSSPTASIVAPAPNVSQTPTPTKTAISAAGAPVEPAAPARELRPGQATPGRAFSEEGFLDELREDVPSAGLEALPAIFIAVPVLGLIFLLKGRFFS